MNALANHDHAGLDQYSLDILLAIQRDLVRNPKSQKERTWEHGRLKAITKEINRRIK